MSCFFARIFGSFGLKIFEFSTGSLGHGLPFGLGKALALKTNNIEAVSIHSKNNNIIIMN